MNYTKYQEKLLLLQIPSPSDGIMKFPSVFIVTSVPANRERTLQYLQYNEQDNINSYTTGSKHIP